MATHPSVPSRVTSGHCSGGGLSPVGGSRWPCEDGGPLAPCPSPKASAMCCGSPSPRKPLPVPGAQRDRSKWGLWTEQGRGPLATRGHTPGGARRTGCPHKLPPSEAALWDRRRAPRVGSSRHRRGWTAGRRQGRGLLSPAALPSPSRQVFVVELLGRRLLILLGFSICFTACCVLTAALALQVRRGGTEETARAPHPLRPRPAFRRSSSGIRRHRLLEEEPGATLPNAAERLAPGDRGSRRPLAQAASALPGVIRLFSARRTQYRGCLTSASRASSPTSSDTPLGPVCTRSCFRACAAPRPAPSARAPQRGPGRRSSLSHRGLGRAYLVPKTVKRPVWVGTRRPLGPALRAFQVVPGPFQGRHGMSLIVLNSCYWPSHTASPQGQESWRLSLPCCATGPGHPAHSRSSGRERWRPRSALRENSPASPSPQAPSPRCSSPRSSCSPPGRPPSWWGAASTGSPTSPWAWSSPSFK